MVISRKDLRRWRDNSVLIALELGLDKSVLDFLKANAKLNLVNGLPPEGMFYGWCTLDKIKPSVHVCSRNLSTEDLEHKRLALLAKGMPSKLVDEIAEVFLEVNDANFFEIYNQSGMDHELIGHLYNYLKDLEHDEPAAVRTQIEFARVRAAKLSKSGRNWGKILKIMPIVLGYHKGIDELKG